MSNIVETRINPLDFETDIAIGLSLPITTDNNMNFKSNYLTFDQIKTNLKNLLLTEPGERIMLPEYGCGLRRRLFENDTNKNKIDIETLVRNSVSRWMPFVTIDDISITNDPKIEYTLNIHIEFSVELYNKKDTLTLPITNG
jgi:hypothetical protein